MFNNELKSFRITIFNDILKIMTKDKTIKLTLTSREGADTVSEIFLEVYTHKKIEGYDVPQFVGEPDYHEFVDSFYFEPLDIIICGTKEWREISSEDEEPEYREEVYWCFDKGEQL